MPFLLKQRPGARQISAPEQPGSNPRDQSLPAFPGGFPCNGDSAAAGRVIQIPCLPCAALVWLDAASGYTLLPLILRRDSMPKGHLNQGDTETGAEGQPGHQQGLEGPAGTPAQLGRGAFLPQAPSHHELCSILRRLMCGLMHMHPQKQPNMELHQKQPPGNSPGG